MNHLHDVASWTSRFQIAHRAKSITIKTVPRTVVINHKDLIGSNALFAKSANAVVTRDKDYISTVLQTQKQMIKVVPLRPDQIVDFFDPNGTPRSVRTIAEIFEGKKAVKDTLVRNWLRAAFVAKDLGNNADSTSQLQIEPDLPEYFSLEQSSTFYTDLQIGFDNSDHTFGTTVANGIRNCLHPAFIPEPIEEVIDVDNVTARNVRPRTTTAAPANTTNNALLQRTNSQNKTSSGSTPTPRSCYSGGSCVHQQLATLQRTRLHFHRHWFQRRINIPVPSTKSTRNHV
jgi:hypothetical protein